MANDRKFIKGRGAASQPLNRFHTQHSVPIDDGWGNLDETIPVLKTQFHIDASKSVVTYNDSPDVPMNRSVNPYRGCEHGCIYCYARPSHAWLDLSPGLDFEQQIFYKPNAATLLQQALAHPSYDCAPLAIGINTDAYQPAEQRLQITRQILKVLHETQHPVGIITKSALVERDLDWLADMATKNLVQIMISITTLDAKLARAMEPRAASPQRRLKTIQRLSEAGIPVGVLLAPVIPVLTDSEIESILEATREQGACFANYILIRLPHEVSPLFREWLQIHRPLQAKHIMQRIQDCHSGKDYDARFGTRMTGRGIFSTLYQKRFKIARDHLGFHKAPQMDKQIFRKPSLHGQMSLF